MTLTGEDYYVERTKEEILSQIQLKTEEQKKLEIHYKTEIGRAHV